MEKKEFCELSVDKKTELHDLFENYIYDKHVIMNFVSNNNLHEDEILEMLDAAYEEDCSLASD